MPRKGHQRQVRTAAYRATAERPSRSHSKPAPAKQLPELPEEVISCILQHVAQQERLSSCALVCRAWAAAAATTDVDAQLESSEHGAQLQVWLRECRGVVVTLRMRPQSSTCVPWRSWRPLQLHAAKLMRLLSLHLSFIRVQLAVQGVSTRNSTRNGPSSFTGTSSTSTSGIGSSLMVGGSRLMFSGADAISGNGRSNVVLPDLQELRLFECSLTVQLASQLLSSPALTKLQWQFVELRNDNWTRPLTQGQGFSTLWQRLQLLPKLSNLHLAADNLTAADIASLSSLAIVKHLRQLTLQLWCSYGADQGRLRARELLSTLQHLTQLRQLKLYNCRLCDPRPQQQLEGDSYQCFSALTAST